MKAKLYAIAHSHAALAARLMLERSGLEYEVWNILPGLHAPIVRAAGFPRWTVPALRIDGRRVQGRMKVHMDDGTELELGPGEVAEIMPGHDAEVVGDETCVFIDFGDVTQYAKSG